MDKTFIKICGVTDPYVAAQTAELGADFIGIIFHAQSSRYVSVANAIPIAAAIREAGAIPVAVFVNHTASEMETICHATEINTVQLHGAIAKAYQAQLPAHYKRIYAQQVNALGETLPEYHLKGLIPERDWLLIDASTSGSGQPFNWHTFEYQHTNFRWFLAGGLSALNVKEAYQKLKPTGVDVSSHVESYQGQKDLRLIKNFIKAVQEEK